MTSSQYGPYGQGCTRTTMLRYRMNRIRKVEEISKTGPSSDWRLQFASMKPESLVMAHQHLAP